MAFLRAGLIIVALLLGWGVLRVVPPMVQSARAPAITAPVTL